MERIGSYKILQQISTEGGGQLFEAIDEQIERRAIIKILHKDLAKDQEAIDRFLNQARIVNLINHPSIASIYEHGQLENGSPYVVMEFLSGETLRDRLRRLGGRIAPYPAMRLVRQVASALAAAHAKQVVHRDLKPVNLMLIPDGETADGERVKVLNFGIAKLTTPAPDSLHTRAGVTMGTPTYMSPEQCTDAREVTDKSDVYALGIVMYEMLTGAPPFSDAEGQVGVMLAHMQQDPPPLGNRVADASPELCALVHRLLAKSPEARPSAADTASILAGLTGGTNTGAVVRVPAPTPPAAPPESLTRMPPPRPPAADEETSTFNELWRSPRGRRAVIAAAGLLGLGFVGIIAAIQTIRQLPPAPPPLIHWAVVSEPADAEVTDETGHVLGRTPWYYEQPSSRGLSTLTLHKPGYNDETLVLDRARDGQHQVTLIAPPAAPPPPPPVAAPPADAPPRRRKGHEHPPRSPKPSRRHQR